MSGIVVCVKVSKGDDSIVFTGAHPIDAIEFMCKVQRSIELGKPLKTEDAHGRAVISVTCGSTESGVQG